MAQINIGVYVVLLAVLIYQLLFNKCSCMTSDFNGVSATTSAAAAGGRCAKKKGVCSHNIYDEAINGFTRGFLTGFVLGNFESGIVTGLALSIINPILC